MAATPERVQKVMANIQLIVNLYWRWLDEREYEDINEYGKVIASKLGFPVQMTKRPFGFKFDNYQAKVTGGNNAKLQVFRIA